MIKRIYNILSVCLFMLLASACYDDKGNYDYHEISTIRIEGLQKNYSGISYKDVLHLEPVVTASGGESEFDYLWTLNLTKEFAVSEKIELDTLGTDRILDFPLNIKQGFYDLALRITNKSNQQEIYKIIPLITVTEFSEGFYLLKAIDNSTDVDLHLPDNGVIGNILLKMQGAHMPDAPVSFGLDPGYSFVDTATGKAVTTQALTICTENDVRISDIGDMSIIYSHNTMFHGDEVPVEKPYYVWRNGYGVGYISDKGVYFSYQASSQSVFGSGKFGFPVTINKEDTKPNKNGIFSGMKGFYYFDELKGRLLIMDYNGKLTSYSEPRVNGIRHHLKFFGRNYMNRVHTGYALFEDEKIPGKHYIYQLVFGRAGILTSLDVKEVDASSKLNRANLFGVNELSAKVMYFVTDNQLYVYDVESKTEKQLSPTDMVAGEEITYISNRFWTGESLDKDSGDYDLTGFTFDYFVFATHKDGKYKVYLYNMVGGEPYGKPVRVLEGEGKVVKMHYVHPAMNMNSQADLPGTF